MITEKIMRTNYNIVYHVKSQIISVEDVKKSFFYYSCYKIIIVYDRNTFEYFCAVNLTLNVHIIIYKKKVILMT